MKLKDSASFSAFYRFYSNEAYCCIYYGNGEEAVKEISRQIMVKFVL